MLPFNRAIVSIPQFLQQVAAMLGLVICLSGKFEGEHVEIISHSCFDFFVSPVVAHIRAGLVI